MNRGLHEAVHDLLREVSQAVILPRYRKLAEHEITRLISLVKAIADRLEVERAADPELNELERDVAPEAVLQELAEDEGEEKE